MRPGLSIQHTSLPGPSQGQVRCDIGALLGFLEEARWPEGASSGDFLELELQHYRDLEDSPDRNFFSEPTRRAAQSFFENGGRTLKLFAVCIPSLDELKLPSSSEGPLLPLFDRLRTEEEIALLAVPEAAYARCEVARVGTVRSEADNLYRLLLAHCREMINRFLIIDSPRGLHGELVLRWFDQLKGIDPHVAGYGAAYYPWLKNRDDVFPPSGAIIGLFARMELEHPPSGVGWPPANAPLYGATHTEVELDWGEAGQITDSGLNPLVVQPCRGVVVWGARTLSTDPTWRFINSRRIVSMITEQLRRDNEWAVFEINSRSLWKTIERDVLVRLDQFWQAGIISGTRSQEEYSVECSEATNPLALREAGQLNVRVSLKPVGTTERILIDMRLGGG
jgi:hypothetical protein